MQIYDEILVEVNEDSLESVTKIIYSTMTNVYPEFIVPLNVKLCTGRNWANLNPLQTFL